MSQLFGRLAQRPIRRPSRALVVAGLAVFISMTGTAYAANTVFSTDIVDNEVVSADLRDGFGVDGIDVIDHSLTGADLNMATVPGVARKFSYAANGSGDPTLKTSFLNYAGFIFKGTCLVTGTSTSVVLREAGPTAWLDYSLVESANTAAHPTSEAGSQKLRGDRDGLATGVDRPVMAVSGPDPNGAAPYIVLATGSTYRRAQGTAFLYPSSGLTVQIDIDAIADNTAHTCQLKGTITNAV